MSKPSNFVPNSARNSGLVIEATNLDVRNVGSLISFEFNDEQVTGTLEGFTHGVKTVLFIRGMDDYEMEDGDEVAVSLPLETQYLHHIRNAANDQQAVLDSMSDRLFGLAQTLTTPAMNTMPAHLRAAEAELASTTARLTRKVA